MNTRIEGSAGRLMELLLGKKKEIDDGLRCRLIWSMDYIYQTKQTNNYRYLDVALFLFLPSRICRRRHWVRCVCALTCYWKSCASKTSKFGTRGNYEKRPLRVLKWHKKNCIYQCWHTVWHTRTLIFGTRVPNNPRNQLIIIYQLLSKKFQWKVSYFLHRKIASPLDLILI